MKRIDLHVHTTCSDGHLTPKEIIDKSYENNVCVLSIADHDTTEAYTDELFEYAKSKNINLIPAVEISTKYNKIGIHVLGYNFELENEELKQELYKSRNSRHIYLHEVAEKLINLGYELDVEELDKIDSVTKAHIALDIIENPNNQKLLLDVFKHIPEKGEFIETIMNEGCPAYVLKKTMSPKDAADIIRKAGGKVVLAHPVAYCHEDGLTEKDIQNLVDHMKPDGIEANYIYVDRNNIKFNELDKWNAFAEKNNLFTTIGSDFHNSDGIRPEIGFINEEIYMPDEKIYEIVNYLSNK